MTRITLQAGRTRRGFTRIELPFDKFPNGKPLSGPRPAAKRKPGGFTLIELLVVIAIIALLMSILLPALGQAKEHARSVVCQSNLRTIAPAVTQYANDYREIIVPGEWWPPAAPNCWATLLCNEGYLTAPLAEIGEEDKPRTNSVFHCPSGDNTVVYTPQGNMYPELNSRDDGIGYWGTSQIWTRPDDSEYRIHVWYGVNMVTVPTERFPFVRLSGSDTDTRRLHVFSEVERPAEMVAFYDGVWAHNCGTSGGQYARIFPRHMTGTLCNAAFLDGHAEPIERQVLPVGPLCDEDSYVTKRPEWCLTLQ
jgi:prepilin-type N-terminal cleavage/methylation domain-containing protein/prepilin-type processing-associated H-X9-DG protein